MNKSSKQKMMIEILLSSADTFAICKSILKAEYFNPEFRQLVQFIHEYYDKYSTTPSFPIVEAETEIKLTQHQITNDEISFCADEVETFCKRKAIEHAVVKSSTLINSDNSAEIEQIIRDACSISLHRNAGSDYFLNVRSRLERMAKTPQRIPTGWLEIDEMLGGGMAKGELLLFSANSGGGKSITLGNVAVNYVMSNHNVWYITLELSSDLVEQRFDCMFSGIPTVNWQENINNIVDKVTKAGIDCGNLVVDYMSSGTTANEIRGKLKEFQLTRGYTPEVLILDYIDLASPNNKNSNDGVFEKDKACSEQLRSILNDFNMIGFTASQQNRSAVNVEISELNHSHIAGGISKVNTVDWYYSIIFNPAMKAREEIIFLCLKSRSSDAVGKKCLLKWDNNRLRILDAEIGSQNNFKLDLPNKPTSINNLFDLIDV